jgi:hypothetical protein
MVGYAVVRLRALAALLLTRLLSNRPIGRPLTPDIFTFFRGDKIGDQTKSIKFGPSGARETKLGSDVVDQVDQNGNIWCQGVTKFGLFLTNWDQM